MTDNVQPHILVVDDDVQIRELLKDYTALSQARQREVRAYRFAEFELNLRTRRLKKQGGVTVEMANGELNLLAALLAAPQRNSSRGRARLLVTSSPRWAGRLRRQGQSSRRISFVRSNH